jgi:mercuric ion transport protein
MRLPDKQISEGILIMNVELLYLPGCLNVDNARKNLRVACQQLGKIVEWQEHNLESPDAPPEYKQYGSPTILVNGRDVAPAEQANGSG